MRAVPILTLVATVAGAAALHAQGTITDGDVSLVRVASSFDSTPTVDLTGVTAIPGDQMFEMGWWYSTPSAMKEEPFGPPSSSSYDGDSSQTVWNTLLTSGLLAVESVTVTDTGSFGNPGDGGLIEIHLVLDNSSGSAQQPIVYFYFDLDLGGAGAGSDDVAVNSEYPLLLELSHATNNDRAYVFTESPDRFEVGAYATLRDKLNDNTVTVLSNGGVPFGPGDFTGAYSFAFDIPNFHSVGVTIYIAVNASLHCGIPFNGAPEGIFCDWFESQNFGFWSSSSPP